MLATLVRFSIRYAGIVIGLACLVLLYGTYRFSTAGLDIFPEFSPKRVIIQTESPGLSPEQVEILVSKQIESAVSGLVGLRSLRSESIQGLSIVTANFDENSDIYRNRQLVSERLARLTAQLPQGAIPVAIPLSSSSATVLTIGLNANNKDLLALRNLVDWTIAPRLLSVPGVADVNVFGGDIAQLQVQVDPVQLRRFNLSLDDVIQAATQAVNQQGGGFIENANQRFTLQVTGYPATPEQFSQAIIPIANGDGTRNLTLGEVASIRYAPEPPIGAAQIMGKSGIVMMVIGQLGANTLTVSKQVEQALQEFAPIFRAADINFYPHLFRPADYIERSLDNLSEHLLIGCLFVLIILFLFLFNFRTALISALAIPVSLMGATLVLLEAGTNLNIMVLGGLTIALGEVVDDAIIDTENIFRRLRENRLLPQALPVAQVVYQASLEVRSSVVYASFIVALVFVPLLTLDGVAGRLFAPLGLSYILAILVSLLVALTLTPALCLVLLGKQSEDISDPPLIRWLKPIYKQCLQWIFRYLNAVMLGTCAICLIGTLSFSALNKQFMPELREGHYMIHTSNLPGTSLQESLRIGSKITEQVLAIEGVESVSQWAGRAERGADTYGSHYSEYEVRLKPMGGYKQQQIKDQIRAKLAQFPGVGFEVNTFLTERIDETISGYTAPVVVNIYGNDLHDLDQKAEQIANIMRGMTGTEAVQVRSPASTPLLQIHLNLEQLALWGISPGQVTDAIQTAYETRVVGKQLQGNKVVDIAVTLPTELKHHTEAIGELPLRSPDGSLVKLEQVADVQFSAGRYNILHQGGQRLQTVTCQVTGGDLEGFMQTLKENVFKQVSFPVDSYPEFTGAAIEQADTRHALIVHSLLAGSGVLMLIYIAIGNLRHALLTLANLPFALLGGVAAVWLTGASVSVGSVVGFVTLFGITVRNSIMLLSHYQHLLAVEGLHWNPQTAIQGAQERLPSILMTALVTALAMFPIAFNSDNPGREIMGPMAAIIIGGLASSTGLNLLLLPGLLVRFGRFKTNG
ncbi:efflux RND transporter permease subunit [Methylosoma difficile]